MLIEKLSREDIADTTVSRLLNYLKVKDESMLEHFYKNILNLKEKDFLVEQRFD